MLTESGNPNPYLIALFTAVLSGVFAISGFHFTAKLQAKNAITQKQYEYRAAAYASFLGSMNRTKSPIIAEILSIGEISRHVATDREIQALEDNFARLAELNNQYDISCQIDSVFCTLRLHGSGLVRKYCDDILTVLALREHDVHWSEYSIEIQEYRNKWVEDQNGIAYGWEERVTNEERVLFILLSTLYKNLLSQLRNELHGEST